MRSQFAALFLAALAGCAAPSKSIDWNARVGVYTYDRTVSELGPPEHETKLTDGTRVAEWHVGDRGGMNLSFGLGGYSQHTGVGVGQEVGTIGGRHNYLRLSFDPEGRLKATATVAR